MQSPIVIAALAGIASSFTPSQVKEDLDTHPWRPAPSSPVAKPAPAVVQETVKTAPDAPKPTGQAAPVSGVASASGVWQLQLAALSSGDAAKTEQKRLEKILGTGKIEVQTDGAVNRLRYGSFTSKEAAESARDELRAKGVEGFPVKKP